MGVRHMGTITNFKIFNEYQDILLESGYNDARIDQYLRVAGKYVQKKMYQENVTMEYSNGAIGLYPVTIGLSSLNKDAELELSRRMKVILGCLERIIKLYYHDPIIRDFLKIPASLRQFVDKDINPSHHKVDLCRFDLIGESIDNLKIIEFNTNCPAGIVYFGLINKFWRDSPVIGDIIKEWGVKESLFENKRWFLSWMEEIARSRGINNFDSINIVYQKGGNFHEMYKLQKIIRQYGYNCKLLDPFEVAESDQSSVIYLKCKVQNAISNAECWEKLCHGIIEGKIVVPNSLAGRWIGDNKLCLAILSDPKFSFMFSEDEKAVINSIIPWSRKLGEGIEVQEVINNKDDLVLKGPYDTRGNSVYIGKEHNKSDWREIVKKPIHQGFLVQEFHEIPRIHYKREPYYRDLTATIINGQIAGYRSRISKKIKVNVAQGGANHAVLGYLAQ
jgi:glutathionylspermidine synthase